MKAAMSKELQNNMQFISSITIKSGKLEPALVGSTSDSTATPPDNDLGYYEEYDTSEKSAWATRCSRVIALLLGIAVLLSVGLGTYLDAILGWDPYLDLTLLF